MPRVVVIEGSGRGFLCQYAHALVLGLHALGQDVTLIMGRRDELADFPIGVPKERCNLPGTWGWFCLSLRMLRMRPDIVHIQWIDRPLLAYLFIKLVQVLGSKVVYTPHNILPHRLRWLSTPLYRLVYHAVDRVVARDTNIAWGLEELMALPERRVSHVPGSPNLMAHPEVRGDELLGLPVRMDGEFRMLFFGHGSSRKGLAQLLDAVSATDWPEQAHLVVAGEGVAREVSEQFAKVPSKMRVTVIDRYVPPRAVSTLFRSSDVLLMPYQKQCKSPLLDLAAAFCVPALRTDRVEGSNFVEGRHGRTIAHDQFSAFVQAMKEWCGNPCLLEPMRDTLTKDAGLEQTCRALAERHVFMYDDVVQKTPPAFAKDGGVGVAAKL
ncbi:MAG: glycosyltransferase family 4 protein [Rhodospirillales bacterium]|nr:glycosyltransferase family 4 protein [Rhodospirillales bacterium]